MLRPPTRSTSVPSIAREFYREKKHELTTERNQLQRRASTAEKSLKASVLSNLSMLPMLSRYSTVHKSVLADDDATAELLKGHFEKSVTRHRGPAQGDPHREAPKLEVVRIERLVNPRLQEKYLAEVQDIAGLCERKVSPLPPVVEHATEVKVESFPGLKLNERLLYHGAPSELIERLRLQGLDPRRAGSNFGKLYGHGVYLAANSSKSDIYTKPNADGERCILVVRACLGETHRAPRAMQNILMPPERSDKRGPLNSVTALRTDQGGVVEHSEFIVYKESQCLPEFAIWYKHKDGCNCTHCCGLDVD